jgi:hypothetical protein
MASASKAAVGRGGRRTTRGNGVIAPKWRDVKALWNGVDGADRGDERVWRNEGSTHNKLDGDSRGVSAIVCDASSGWIDGWKHTTLPGVVGCPNVYRRRRQAMRGVCEDGEEEESSTIWFDGRDGLCRGLVGRSTPLLDSASRAR